MPSLNTQPSSARLIKFARPFNDFQHWLILLTILNTRHSALSRRFIRLVASVLSLTPPEDGLQWVGGPKVHPVLFGIPLQRGERIPVPKHGFSCVLMVT